MIKNIAKWILREEIDLLNNNIKNLQNKISKLISINQINSPKEYSSIHRDEIKKILKTVGTKNYYMRIRIDDIWKNLTSKTQALEYSKKSKIAIKSYITEKHDCENFAYQMKGFWENYNFVFGMAYSSTHAFNIMLDKAKKVWIIEPQNNNFYTIEQAKKLSSPDGVNYFPIKEIII